VNDQKGREGKRGKLDRNLGEWASMCRSKGKKPTFGVREGPPRRSGELRRGLTQLSLETIKNRRFFMGCKTIQIRQWKDEGAGMVRGWKTSNREK